LLRKPACPAADMTSEASIRPFSRSPQAIF
jgi:hypothetical protein